MVGLRSRPLPEQSAPLPARSALRPSCSRPLPWRSAVRPSHSSRSPSYSPLLPSGSAPPLSRVEPPGGLPRRREPPVAATLARARTRFAKAATALVSRAAGNGRNEPRPVNGSPRDPLLRLRSRRKRPGTPEPPLGSPWRPRGIRGKRLGNRWQRLGSRGGRLRHRRVSGGYHLPRLRRRARFAAAGAPWKRED